MTVANATASSCDMRARRMAAVDALTVAGLDDAHIPPRRAYEAVGFDRAVPTVDLWQRL